VDEAALARLLRDATNLARMTHGCAPLVGDRLLEQAALQHAQRMRNLAFFAHQDPCDGKGLGERLDAVRAHALNWAGENLALCPPDAELTVRLWLDSPGHRSNLLDPAAVRVGQAAARAPDGRVYWVQLYGRARPDVRPTPPRRQLIRMSARR
jgi:uncharacterized protein YkwD